MKKNFFVLTLSMICLTLSTFAQSDSTSTELPAPSSLDTAHHHVGVHAGVCTGLGFSYRYTKNKIGLQLTGIPIFNDGLSFVSGGVALTYRPLLTPENSDKMQFLVYTGGHVLATGYSRYSYIEALNIAVGLGLEQMIFNNITFNLMLGYGLNLADGINTIPSIETGFHYKIK